MRAQQFAGAVILLPMLVPLVLGLAAPQPVQAFDNDAPTFQSLRPGSTFVTSLATAPSVAATPTGGSKAISASDAGSVVSAGESFATSASSGLVGSATASGHGAASTNKPVHFDCGTNIGHADNHFLDTIHGHYKGQYPNGTAFNGTAGGIFGGQYDAHSTNGISRRQNASGPAAGAIAVKVYIHVVTTAAHAGMVTQFQVNQQVAELNSAYNPYGISFKLANASFTTNDAWAIGGNDTIDLAMKSALRQGAYADLNLYLQSDMAGGVLGQCTLPTDIGGTPSPSVYVRDGCNIAAGTVPGGPINGYNMGKTAVHETGHWLGLLHTFEGYSCTGNGDFVGDTPSEAQSTDGCPTSPWKNTCPGRTGLDPIHNYMDYSTDACYSRFTPGQQQRIHVLWPQYRAGK